MALHIAKKRHIIIAWLVPMLLVAGTLLVLGAVMLFSDDLRTARLPAEESVVKITNARGGNYLSPLEGKYFGKAVISVQYTNGKVSEFTIRTGCSAAATDAVRMAAARHTGESATLITKNEGNKIVSLTALSGETILPVSHQSDVQHFWMLLLAAGGATAWCFTFLLSLTGKRIQAEHTFGE